MEQIKDLKIERNHTNGGLWPTFKIGGKEFAADICDVLGAYVECMIFPSKNGKVTSWGELYCNRNVNVTEKDLIRCINEFAEGKFHSMHENRIDQAAEALTELADLL